MIFYFRSRTHSLWDFVETPGARLWKGGEEGGLKHMAVTAHLRRRVCPVLLSPFQELFFQCHSSRVLHTFNVGGLNFTGLIS